MREILVIAKKEFHRYSGSYVEMLAVALILALSIGVLFSQEFERLPNPGAYGIYRVGFTQGVDPDDLMGFSFRIIDLRGMDSEKALREGLVDVVVFESDGVHLVRETENPKSRAAREELARFFKKLNADRVYLAAVDKPLEDRLFPIRLRQISKNVSYDGTSDYSLRRQRMRENSRSYDRETRNIVLMEEEYEESLEEGNLTESIFSFPDDIEDVFPFRSVYQNIGFLATSMLISILAGLSLMREQVTGSLNNLFMTPAKSSQILLGKSLPYLCVMAAFNIFFGTIIADGFNALLIGLVFTFISLTLLVVALAVTVSSVNYRDLSFKLSFTLLAFFFYMILPNVFSGINPLSSISPLEIIVRLQNDVRAGPIDVFWSLLPYNFFTISLFTYSTFTLNPESGNRVKSIYGLLRRYYNNLSKYLDNWMYFTVSTIAFSIPVIYLLQNMMTFTIFPISRFIHHLWIIVVVFIAFIEEVFKLMPYLDNRRLSPIKYGVFAGTCFFIFEKSFNLYLIQKVYTLLPAPWTILVTRGMLLTLFIHIGASTISAWGVHQGRGRLFSAAIILLAVLLHAAYNILAPFILLGGM